MFDDVNNERRMIEKHMEVMKKIECVTFLLS